MGYNKIDNLYRNKDLIFMFREVVASEKVHGSSAHLTFTTAGLSTFPGGIKQETFNKMLAERFDIPAVTAKALEKLSPDITEITVYGEVYGGSCQKMSQVYGPLNFIAFEVKVGDYWLGPLDAYEFVLGLGLPFVPFEVGPATVEWLTQQRDRPSEVAKRNGMGDDKPTEGVVVRPLKEFTLNGGKRVVAKFKREEHRETAEPREVGAEELKVLTDAEAIANEWVVPERLQHVLSALAAREIVVNDTTATGHVIKEMVKDVQLESVGEVVWDGVVAKAIAKKAKELFHEYLSTELTRSNNAVPTQV